MNETPLIRIIIPVKDDQENIKLCIQAIQDERHRHNIIENIFVVDNGSTDSTRQIARVMGCTVMVRNGNVATVRNFGSRHANTPYLGFIDSDVIISPDWSLHVKRSVTNPETGEILSGIVTGSTCDIPSNPTWMESAWFASLSMRDNHSYINSGNLIIDSKLFEKISGFDEGLNSGEDVDICARAVNTGGSILYNQNIHTVHLGYPKTIRQFVKREIWHGREMLRDGGNPFKNKALMLAATHCLFLLVLLILGISSSIKEFLVVLMTYPLFPLTLATIRLKKLISPKIFTLGILYSLYGFARCYSLISESYGYLFRKKDFQL